MNSSFLFYDLETSGLNPSFDQVMQFAAIRTDLNFLEIERKEIYVKLRPDVVPAPEALLTTRILVSETKTNAISEYDAIKEIHSMLNKPGTISIGYNTLGFDDEFLRFSFYRNLLDMYSHQYANGCSRADLFPMLLYYFLFQPEVLKHWPKNEDSKVNLKLENLSKLNQLAEGNAHDAMVDVEATLALAQRMASYPDLWSFCLANFNKKTDEERSKKFIKSKNLGKIRIDLSTLLNTKIGSENGYQAPVILLGQNAIKQTLFLRLDNIDFNTVNEENYVENTWVTRKKYGEPGFLIPDNKREISYFKEERVALIQSNLNWINDNSELFNKIKQYWLAYEYPEVESVDLDARLYLDSFWKPKDKQINLDFHEAKTVNDKKQVIEKMQNSSLKKLAKRIIYRNFKSENDLFSDEESTDALFNSQTGIDFRNSEKLTKENALDRIEELKKSYTNTQDIEILDSLKNYLLR